MYRFIYVHAFMYNISTHISFVSVVINIIINIIIINLPKP